MKRVLLITCYLVFVTGANVLLKRSAEAGAGWPFLLLLIAGNLAGFVGILAYTGLLRELPLHIAFPLTRGFVVIGILASSVLVFGERIRLTEAAGVALVAAGIILVGRGTPRGEPAGGAGNGMPTGSTGKAGAPC